MKTFMHSFTALLKMQVGEMKMMLWILQKYFQIMSQIPAGPGSKRLDQ